MKLLDQVRQSARVKHFSYRTEQAYVYWVERFIRFHGIRHPNSMGAPEVEAFLTALAVQSNVAASTQNQALAALLFLYHDVLGIDIGRLDAVRARRPKRVPTVLSRAEVGLLLRTLDQLPTSEPYGHVGVYVDARRVGVEDGQRHRWRAGRTRRRLGLRRPGLGRRTLVLSHGVGYLVGVRAKTAGAGQEGNRRIALSPTGSTHQWAPKRVTNDRVAASRARLECGHEAPEILRPRTRAGCSTIHQDHDARNTRPKPTQVHGRQGPRAARRFDCPRKLLIEAIGVIGLGGSRTMLGGCRKPSNPRFGGGNAPGKTLTPTGILIE